MRNQSGVEVRVQDGEVWLTQKAIGQLFGVDRSVVTQHLQCIYAGHEADESSTCANFAQVAKMQETRNKMPATSVHLSENLHFLQFCVADSVRKCVNISEGDKSLFVSFL